MPHAVPFATLALGLGLMGGAVAGIHELGSAQAPSARVQQRVDVVRVSDDGPRGHRCPHQAAQDQQQRQLQ